MKHVGIVYLVGAGPGDPGLITLRGLECIRRADVLVYDRLAPEKLVAQARADAETVYVGKESSRHTLRQEQINQLLVDRARQGLVVTRLKGGDPFVFGRGGEEAQTLATAGIPFEIIPGVTSAIAGPAYAGIPVTHRGVASSVAFVTGHEDPNKELSAINWSSLATGVDTLVFLMGVENLAAIAHQLVRHGRAPSTPAALIRWGTLTRQRTLVATLTDIAHRAQEEGFGPPAILVVGQVVSLREQLRWFDNRPLFGQRILVTRSRHQASVLAQQLAQQGAEVVELPTIAIQPPDNWQQVDEALTSIASYEWLVFTSANGVASFFSHLNSQGRDARALHNVKIAAIGPATAEALRARGVKADYVPTEFIAEAIAAGLGDLGIAGQKVLLARAQEVREALAARLTALGAKVSEIAVYRTVLPDIVDNTALQQLVKGEMDVVTFTSSSTVKNLVALLNGDIKPLNKLTVACIGPITAATARNLGIRVDIIAKEYTIAGLVQSLLETSRVED